MTEIRREIHDEVNRMPDQEVIGLKEFLKTYPTPLDANALPDDEPLTEEDRILIEEAEEWLKHNEAIPHEEVLRRRGLG